MRYNKQPSHADGMECIRVVRMGCRKAPSRGTPLECPVITSPAAASGPIEARCGETPMSSAVVSPHSAPVVIVGAGLAGLTVALHVAEKRPVVVLAKRDVEEGATAWAQGGIVGVLGSDDSIESHVRDTQDAGAGLVDEQTARFIAEHSADAVEWLVRSGVPFS